MSKIQTQELQISTSQKGVSVDGPLDISTQCLGCENFKNKKRFTCRAFPKGIPSKIISGNFDHTKPFPGDKGIRFEPLSKEILA